jgi:hypothetical protein
MTLSPYKKYMVVARKYQFNVLVNLSFFSFEGTLAMAMTSLKHTTWIAVTMAIRYKCPANMEPKNRNIMRRVVIVRTMNVCFFFSYSFTGASGCYRNTLVSYISSTDRILRRDAF